jgi:WD40 repeat protein
MPNDSLPVSVQLHLEEVCARFETGWQAAGSAATAPRIEEHLGAAAEPERAALLRELLRLDVHYRRRHGENPDADYYAARCPADAQVVRALFAELFGVPQLPRQVAAVGDSGGTMPPGPAVETGVDPNRTGPVQTRMEPETAPAEYPAIPNYEILGELGRGGMGVVYKARQTALKRLVALKMILSGDLASPQELARFRREAEAVARLQHPNIVQVYEVGEWRAGDVSPPIPFFSLEFVNGGTLATKLRESLPAPKQAAALVEQLARAMHAVHRCSVVHRDLKPANVLMTADGTPKITDFGLAKKLDEDAGQTHSGAVMGTPSYMAPEQASGGTARATPQADVYALGAILYECLTGRPPFRAATVAQTLRQVVEQEPVPPRFLNAAVPHDLETICLKSLRKEAPKRYATAEALADDLRRWLHGEPIQARPVGPGERALKWVQRRPAVAALLSVTVVMVLALVGGGVSLFYSGRLQDALRNEAQQRALAEEQEARAVAASQEAEKQWDRAERLVYARQIALAQAMWHAGDVRQAWALLDTCRRDLRGWEYNYLYTLFTSNQHTFRGHTGNVYSVGFSPDGKRLVSGSDDKTIKVWDAQTGQQTLSLQGHTGPVLSVAFSPDGKRLLSGSGDGGVKLWDAQTGQQSLSLQVHTHVVFSVGFSPDGKRLASASGLELEVWGAQSGQLTRSLSPPGLRGKIDRCRWFTSVVFSPDGKRLASASQDLETPDGKAFGEAKVWDAQTGQLILSLKGHTSRVTSVAFSPDRQRLASASEDQTVKVWDAHTGQEIHSLRGHTGTVWSVTFSCDGQRLVSGSADKTIRVWDAQTGQEIRTLKGHTAAVRSVAFSPDSKRLASASADGSVKVWDAQTGQETPTLKGHTGSVRSVAFSRDGKRMVSGGGDLFKAGEIKVSDAQTGENILYLPMNLSWVYSMAFSPMAAFFSTTAALRPQGVRGTVTSVVFSPDGKRLASGSRDQTVKVWDAATGQQTLTLYGHTGGVYSVAFSPDGQRLASGSEDQTVKVWDAATGQQILTLKGHTGGVWSVAFSPDGKRLASGSADETVKVWDAATGQQTLTLRGHTGFVRSVAFSPDGKHLASGSADDTVKVWDAHTGQLIVTLQGHTGPVHSVAFSPDGQRLASASHDQTVKVWDAQSGQETLSLQGHTGEVLSVAFSPDGRRLASASADGTVKFWGASGADWLGRRVSDTQPDGTPVDGKARIPAPQEPKPAGKEPEDPVVGELRSFLGHTGHVTSVCLSTDGQRALSAGFDKTLRLWDVERGTQLRRFEGHTHIIWTVALSRDGKRALSGSEDKTVRIWDLDAGKELHRLEGHEGVISSVTFLADGRQVLSACWDRTVRLWDVEGGKQLRRFDVGVPVTAVAVSADGKQALFGSTDGILRIWDLQAGKELRRIDCPKEMVEGVAFAPDGRSALSAHADKTVRQYDLETGKELRCFTGHTAKVDSVTLSPDGRRVLSCGEDCTIRLWDLATGRELFVLKGHRGKVRSAVFSGDGRQILSGGFDGTLKLWGLPK